MCLPVTISVMSLIDLRKDIQGIFLPDGYIFSNKDFVETSIYMK